MRFCTFAIAGACALGMSFGLSAAQTAHALEIEYRPHMPRSTSVTTEGKTFEEFFRSGIFEVQITKNESGYAYAELLNKYRYREGTPVEILVYGYEMRHSLGEYFSSGSNFYIDKVRVESFPLQYRLGGKNEHGVVRTKELSVEVFNSGACGGEDISDEDIISLILAGKPFRADLLLDPYYGVVAKRYGDYDTWPRSVEEVDRIQIKTCIFALEPIEEEPLPPESGAEER